ncbi:hypothetical protein Ait01nite_042060 [Actinoplanes italicus]|nr:hypothetical protein Ait01nite_042060 [Actinoplanes italicus]
MLSRAWFDVVAEGGLRGNGFRWLWASYAVSAYGSAFGFGALPLIAVLVLDAGPGQVSLMARSGLRGAPSSRCRSGPGPKHAGRDP